MSATWGYVAIAIIAVLVRYFMAEAQACLRIGRALSDTGTKTGFQDAVTPPLSSYLALLSYTTALLVVVAQFWMYGVEAGVVSVVIGGATMMVIGLTVIPKPESDFWTRRIYASLVRRVANYRRDGDTMRADAAELLVRRIQERLMATSASGNIRGASAPESSTAAANANDTPDSRSIVSAYGAVLEREAPRLAGAVDASLLPYPKPVILAAILQQLKVQPCEFPTTALVSGAMSLAQFQEGVGAQPIYPFGIDLSKLSNTASPERAREMSSAVGEMEDPHTPERQVILDRAEKERGEMREAIRSIQEEMSAKESFLYFAYGSNMLTKRLAARTPSAVSITVGHVEHHRLTFD